MTRWQRFSRAFRWGLASILVDWASSLTAREAGVGPAWLVEFGIARVNEWGARP